MKRSNFFRVPVCAFLLLPAISPTPALAADWHVAVGGSGNGSSAAPFGRIQDALRLAKAGDTVIVGPGTFSERLITVAAGSAERPIRIRSVKPGSTIITNRGRVLTVNHPYVSVEGVVLDGRFGDDDILRLGAAATGFSLRQSEVRRTSRDAIDMGAPSDVLIENC